MPFYPNKTVESINRNKVALKGPTTTPVGTGHKSANVTLRKVFDLYANVRPAKSIPAMKRPWTIDLINKGLLILFRHGLDTVAVRCPDHGES